MFSDVNEIFVLAKRFQFDLYEIVTLHPNGDITCKIK